MKVYIATASDQESQTNLGVFAEYEKAEKCAEIQAKKEFEDIYVEINNRYPKFNRFELMKKENFTGYSSKDAVWIIAEGEYPSRQFGIEEWIIQ